MGELIFRSSRDGDGTSTQDYTLEITGEATLATRVPKTFLALDSIAFSSLWLEGEGKHKPYQAPVIKGLQ